MMSCGFCIVTPSDVHGHGICACVYVFICMWGNMCGIVFHPSEFYLSHSLYILL